MTTISELSHEWAHAEPNESGEASSLSYVGNDLYSYNTVIARKFRDLVLITNRYYSVTTSNHISLAKNAVTGTVMAVIEVDNVIADCPEYHRRNHDEMKGRLSELIGQYERARQRKPRYAISIDDLVRSANLYNAYFKLRRKDLQAPEGMQYIPESEPSLDRFREHKCRNVFQSDLTYLRVSKKGSEVETSKGITVSISECKKWWEIICRQIRASKSCRGSGATIAGVALDYITEKGVLKAGCHTIPYSESRGIAEHFNWTMPEEPRLPGEA